MVLGFPPFLWHVSMGQTSGQEDKVGRIVSRRDSGRGKWMFSGRFNTTPCKYGHELGRYDSGACKECTRLRGVERERKRKEAHAKLTPLQRERITKKKAIAKAKEEKAQRKEFHRQWEAERKAKREERLNAKLVLDLLS